MNVTTADQAKGAVEEGAGKVGKIEEAAAVNGDANHETVRNGFVIDSGPMDYLLGGLWGSTKATDATTGLTLDQCDRMPVGGVKGM